MSIIFTCLFLFQAFASEYAIRSVNQIIWETEAKESVSNSVGQDYAQEVDKQMLMELNKYLEKNYPQEYALGLERSQASDIQRTYEDLLHILISVSRFQILKANYGSDKTVFSLALTLNISMINLSTGEVLGSDTFTNISQTQKPGKLDRLPNKEIFELASQNIAALPETVFKRFSTKYKIGKIEATVVAKHEGKFILNHGFTTGAFKGETFFDEKKKKLQIHAVQDNFSLATSADKFSVGDKLQHIGLPKVSNSSPKLMILSDKKNKEVAPGVMGSEVNQWLMEALAANDFEVIPPSDSLFMLQSLEASEVNISREALVGNMKQADIIVVPEIIKSGHMTAFDEETETDNFLLETILGCTFIDVNTGSVIFGASVTHQKVERLKDNGRQVNIEESFPGLIKDSALKLVEEKIKASFSPNYLLGKVKKVNDGLLLLDSGKYSFAIGSNVELLIESKKVTDPSTKKDLGFVEDVVGSAKVVGTKKGMQTASINLLSVGKKNGLKVRGLRSTDQQSPIILQLNNVEITPKEYEKEFYKTIENALFSSGSFTVVPTKESSIIETYQNEISSGSYESSSNSQSALLPTHHLNLKINFIVSDIKETKKSMSRKYKIEIDSSISEISSGESIDLLSPRLGLVKEYNMWKEYELKASKKGIVLGLSDQDTKGNLQTYTYETIIDNIGRLKTLSNKALEKK